MSNLTKFQNQLTKLATIWQFSTNLTILYSHKILISSPYHIHIIYQKNIRAYTLYLGMQSSKYQKNNSPSYTGSQMIEPYCLHYRYVLHLDNMLSKTRPKGLLDLKIRNKIVIVKSISIIWFFLGFSLLWIRFDNFTMLWYITKI